MNQVDTLPTKLYLVQQPSTYFTRFDDWLDGLKSDKKDLGQQLDTIHMDGDFLSELSEKNRYSLVSKIAKIDSIQHMHLGRATLSGKAISKLFKYNKGLKILELHNVTIVGGEHDLDSLHKTLFKHPSLEEISFVNFEIDDLEANIQSLLKTLSSLPKLRILQLEPAEKNLNRQNHRLAVSAVNLAPLCRSESLIELDLTGFDIDSIHLRLICRAMIKNNALKTLKLSRSNIDDNGIGLICSSLTKSPLKELDLSFNDGITSRGCAQLSAALSTAGSCLETLSLDGCKQIGVQGLAALAAMLEQNSVLESLKIPTLTSPAGAVDEQLRKQMNERLIQNRKAPAKAA